MDDRGVIQVPAYELPLSAFLDSCARDVLLRQDALDRAAREEIDPIGLASADVAAQRAYLDEHLFRPLIRKMRKRFHVEVTADELGGVPIQRIRPSGWAATQRCVLVNLHGGGFLVGGGLGGQVESIPIAACGGFEVVSVDYRMAPEHRYPAATEDVLNVFEALLRDVAPQSIGIFGCSAGAELTAQTTAAIITHDLPRPGAIGMLCSAGCHWALGDSAHMAAAFTDYPIGELADDPYYGQADPSDPLVFPVNSDAILAQFPPSLLITATRDFVLSSVAHMHASLVRLGVPADLHVWEGLGHAFFYEPDLPQSVDAYAVIARFFAQRLGGGSAAGNAKAQTHAQA